MIYNACLLTCHLSVSPGDLLAQLLVLRTLAYQSEKSVVWKMFHEIGKQETTCMINHPLTHTHTGPDTYPEFSILMTIALMERAFMGCIYITNRLK